MGVVLQSHQHACWFWIAGHSSAAGMAWASWSVDACTGLDGIGWEHTTECRFPRSTRGQVASLPTIHPPSSYHMFSTRLDDRGPSKYFVLLCTCIQAMIYFWISKGAFASFYTFATSSQTPRLFLTHFITSDASKTRKTRCPVPYQ